MAKPKRKLDDREPFERFIEKAKELADEDAEIVSGATNADPKRPPPFSAARKFASHAGPDNLTGRDGHRQYAVVRRFNAQE